MSTYDVTIEDETGAEVKLVTIHDAEEPGHAADLAIEDAPDGWHVTDVEEIDE